VVSQAGGSGRESIATQASGVRTQGWCPRRLPMVTLAGGMGGNWLGPIIDPASDFHTKTAGPSAVPMLPSGGRG